VTVRYERITFLAKPRAGKECYELVDSLTRVLPEYRELVVGNDFRTSSPKEASLELESVLERNDGCAGVHAMCNRGIVTLLLDSIDSEHMIVGISIGWLRDFDIVAKFMALLPAAIIPNFGWYLPQPSGLLLETALTRTWAHLPKGLHGDAYTALRRCSLPHLEGGMHDLSVPSRLGWLNYWSKDVCHRLGFPDESRDAQIVSQSDRLRNGDWLVRLTGTPLDMKLEAHCEAMRWAYERFGSVGKRLNFHAA
jgi:hypothetical protein